MANENQNKNQREFYIVRQKSTKDPSKTFVMLMCDLGYRCITITFDTAIIAELSGVTFQELYNLELDKKYFLS